MILDDLAMIAFTGITMVHIGLPATHAVMEGSILAILTGRLPEEYVVSHRAQCMSRSAADSANSPISQRTLPKSP